MNLPRSIKSKITKNKNSGNVSCLGMTEVVLVHCNIVNNDYQQYLKIVYACVTNKSFSQLLDISPKVFVFLKTFDSEFSYIKI